ncbi:protein FAM50A-like [Chenopodium quinoa]|uniref:protein FAM50A-like n=1 Tax=Chenopodium quinoa TaxID=63459 RepID=UPI000B778B06|nr:protein FAM50A-like [Chenopodium quinoa]
MADDHDPHCVEDIDDDEHEDEYEDEDEDEDDDEPYVVNKEDNLGEPEDQRRVFESLLAERFRGFKTNLTNGWIYKKKKKADEDDLLPWQKWPTVSKDDWEEFVRMKTQKKAIELREQNKKNAEMKEYVHLMGPKTFGEKRPEWVDKGLYPKSLLVASKEPSSSTITTLLEHTQELVEGKLTKCGE